MWGFHPQLGIHPDFQGFVDWVGETLKVRQVLHRVRNLGLQLEQNDRLLLRIPCSWCVSSWYNRQKNIFVFLAMGGSRVTICRRVRLAIVMSRSLLRYSYNQNIQHTTYNPHICQFGLHAVHVGLKLHLSPAQLCLQSYTVVQLFFQLFSSIFL